MPEIRAQNGPEDRRFVNFSTSSYILLTADWFCTRDAYRDGLLAGDALQRLLRDQYIGCIIPMIECLHILALDFCRLDNPLCRSLGYSFDNVVLSRRMGRPHIQLLVRHHVSIIAHTLDYPLHYREPVLNLRSLWCQN